MEATIGVQYAKMLVAQGSWSTKEVDDGIAAIEKVMDALRLADRVLDAVWNGSDIHQFGTELNTIRQALD